MKKLILLAVSSFLILALGCSKYNKPLVVKTMISLKQNMGDLNTAFQAKDYAQTKAQFENISNNLAALQSVTPKKGSKADWDANHNSIIELAKQGMTACDQSDDATIQDVITRMGPLIMDGHKSFR